MKFIRNKLQKVDDVYYIVVDNTDQVMTNAMVEILILKSKTKLDFLWGVFKLNESTTIFFSIEELNKLLNLVIDKNYVNDKILIDKTEFLVCEPTQRDFLNKTLAKGNCAVAVAQKLQKNLEKVNMYIIQESIKDAKTHQSDQRINQNTKIKAGK